MSHDPCIHGDDSMAFDATGTVSPMSPLRSDSVRGLPEIELTLDSLRSANESLNDDVARLSESLCDKFEEVRLIHDLTARLELEDDPTEVCSDVLLQLHGCLNCECVLIQLNPEEDEPVGGQCLGVGREMTLPQLDEIVDAAFTEDAGKTNILSEPLLINHGFLPPLRDRRVVLLPIYRRGQQLGRLICLRRLSQPQFGTVEVDLLRSVLMVFSLHLVNQRQYAEMQSMLEGTVRSLASALDAKDAYTHGHSSRVAELSMKLGRRLGLGDAAVEALQLAGTLHDIGKIGIDDSVLKKPGRLSAEEFDQIKLHPVLGYEILKDIRPFRHILPAVRHHHEAWDGTGYPDGLAGDAIPRDAQILAVADAFDAMVSDRPYRRGMPLDQVLAVFHHGRGTQWAADVVDVLLASKDLLIQFTRKHQRTEVSQTASPSATD